MPRVSVIMPTWNRGHLVEKAINSIINQTFRDWELIVIDDGSSDNTQAVIVKFRSADQRIRYYRNDHYGYAYSINVGCHFATGEFIAFQDDDDISYPERLETEVRELDENPDVELVYGLVRWVDKTGSVIGHFPGMLMKADFRGSIEEGFRSILWNGCKIACPTVMMRKRHFPENGKVFEERLFPSPDWLHHLELAFRYRIVGLSRVLAEMLRDPSHTSMTKHKMTSLNCYRQVLTLAEERLGPEMHSWSRWNHFRKAWGYQYLLEALVAGSWRGLWPLCLAILFRPGQKRAWRRVGEYMSYPVRKLQNTSLHEIMR